LFEAGAGSGKTRVITYKIAWLLTKKFVNPKNIYAVTFTNKAAREMKERGGLTVSTFHSLGMAILREEVDASGRKPGFSIFDPADSLFVVRELLKADLGQYLRRIRALPTSLQRDRSRRYALFAE